MSPPIDMNRFEQIRASGDLPSPKGVALAVIRLTRQEEVSIAELAHVIAGDPAFVGRVIKAANGLIALSRRPVASVQEALMVLGLPAVRTMVLGFSLLSHYRGGACRSFNYNEFWASSLALALSMQVFAERTRVAAPDELFSAGLLARVGELALATLYPTDYSRVLDEWCKVPQQALEKLEQDAFAMSSGELTKAMLADWGLPRIFVEVIAHFGRAKIAGYAEGGRPHVLLLSLEASRCIAELCVADEAARPAMLSRLFVHTERLGLARENVIADCDRIARLWIEWGALLQLDLKPVPLFSELASPVQDSSADPPVVLSPSVDQGVAEQPVAQDLAFPQMPTVLIVDDEPRTRATLRAVLERGGYKVFEAANGREGMERALELQPRMLVLDWNMPEMSGPDLVRALRQTRVGQSIYMLLLAHDNEDQRLIEAFEAGADDFIAKPLKTRALAARLHAGLRVVKLQCELEREREELQHFAAELAVTNRRLQEAALTDALTGFPNRRYAIDRIEQEWSAAERWGRPLSCMIIDLDNFKQINDTHGHDVGDEVLRRSADALRGALRGQDVICRTGGDEFLAICPETDLIKALACAERLRGALTELVITASGVSVAVSASIGVAMRESSMQDVDAFIKQADVGAYIAKQEGRNRVATAPSSASTNTIKIG